MLQLCTDQCQGFTASVTIYHVSLFSHSAGRNGWRYSYVVAGDRCERFATCMCSTVYGRRAFVNEASSAFVSRCETPLDGFRCS